MQDKHAIIAISFFSPSETGRKGQDLFKRTEGVSVDLNLESGEGGRGKCEGTGHHLLSGGLCDGSRGTPTTVDGKSIGIRFTRDLLYSEKLVYWYKA